MKTFTRVIAALMMVAVLASLLAACGQKGYMDESLIGSWTDADDGCTWTFNEDGTCNRTCEAENFNSDGTYWIEQEGVGKIHITLDAWDKEKLCTYAATYKVMVLEHMEFSFRGDKQ